jgi:mRNA-degrading endonuclease RelE of RelBE toxin-antitoxin system
LSLYSLEYHPRTEAELRKLPVRLRRRVDQQLEFLRAAPFRSHPGVTVKATGGVLGVWHFHLSKDLRVHYTTIGPVLYVVMVERSPGVTRKSLREVRKRV